MPQVSISKNQVSRRQMLHWLGIGSAAALLPEMPFPQLELSSIAAATTPEAVTSYPILPPIVLTDDDKFGRVMTKWFLEQEGGFQVIDTPSGEEVLRICQSQAVSLVISDFLRPDMDGRELLRRLRADPTTAHIPFMLCTGLFDPWDEVELDVDCLVYKPFDPDEYVVTVQQLLA